MAPASVRRSPAASSSLRGTVKRRLPKYIRKAINDYAAFADQDPTIDPKGFASHQTACKSALQHLDAALKVLAWAETGPGDRPTMLPDDTDRLINLAERTLAGLSEAEPDEEI